MSPRPRFRFRPLEEADLPLLHAWLNRPHLLASWGPAVSLEEVRAKYLPRVAGRDAARPYVAELDGEPAGYIQFYLASEGVEDWWPDRPGPGVLGIDQFLADGDRLGRGLGTAMISRFAAHLFADPDVTEIRVDPRPDNGRAIRCYEKVGFRSVGPITTPDGPALMMVLDRDAFRARWPELVADVRTPDPSTGTTRAPPIPDSQRSARSMADQSDRRARFGVARVIPLGHERGDDLTATTSASERCEIAWALTLEAWTLAGRYPSRLRS